MTTWRYMLDPPAPGAWNMAVDEALLLSYGAEAGSPPEPVLRFYQWQPACVSLGRFQEYPDRLERVPSAFDVVRRPTGGRAVLHQYELTYAVVIGVDLLPREAHSVLGAYRWLSAGFMAGLRELGVEAALARAEAASGRTPNCFASAALCDFLVRDKKLIGAAQCRKNGVILQHGSLLLEIDEDSWRETLGGSMTEAIALSSLEIEVDFAMLAQHLRRGIERTLHATMRPSPLTAAENALASQLHHEKYSACDWNRGKIETLGRCGDEPRQ